MKWISPIELTGEWKEGYALDFHVLNGVHLGVVRSVGSLAKQVYLSDYDGMVVGSKIGGIVEKGRNEDLVSFIQELTTAKIGEVE
ncbi:hypothetical protein J2Z83_002932 [Virgibacillus natechei]|uniref:Uncharacterized protein n=1 Tax=Virgibacillus natechei TaxID=1216297 RepID=A0ABS4IK28_9BACI|nr:hypothetical protein [Virgibacillus natechei]MBP1970796.1 hypothetical protein [Virgibacillus natechei]UZD12304.1 hypothetical protein OLD84_15465 [Virgibacillus natechei]